MGVRSGCGRSRPSAAGPGRAFECASTTRAEGQEGSPGRVAASRLGVSASRDGDCRVAPGDARPAGTRRRFTGGGRPDAGVPPRPEPCPDLAVRPFHPGAGGPVRRAGAGWLPPRLPSGWRSSSATRLIGSRQPMPWWRDCAGIRRGRSTGNERRLLKSGFDHLADAGNRPGTASGSPLALGLLLA